MAQTVFAMFMCIANAQGDVVGKCYSSGDPLDRPFTSLADCREAAAWWQKSAGEARLHQTGERVSYKCFEIQQNVNVWTPTDP